MSRYIADVELNQPTDVVSMVMEDYLYHNQFSRGDWNGEMVFRRGDSHGTEWYMKWLYAGGIFHLEAWLKSITGGEMDLDGVGGGDSRKEYSQSVEELIERLRTQQASTVAGGHVGADPLHHSEDYEAEHRAGGEAAEPAEPAQKTPKVNTAPIGLILGIAGIVFVILLLLMNRV